VQHTAHNALTSACQPGICCAAPTVLYCAVLRCSLSCRLVVVSFSCLMLGLHYFACALWLVLRVQVRTILFMA
jgi:hypothetical protein